MNRKRRIVTIVTTVGILGPLGAVTAHADTPAPGGNPSVLPAIAWHRDGSSGMTVASAEPLANRNRTHGDDGDDGHDGDDGDDSHDGHDGDDGHAHTSSRHGHGDDSDGDDSGDD